MSDINELSDAAVVSPLTALVESEWQGLLDKEDRTSPAECPDMVLVTRNELAGSMSEAYLLNVSLYVACDGIADDYMTSEKHHPGYVLIPAARFEAITAILNGRHKG
jgi:hypothetical protein